jgi:hypothetical protein
VATFTLSELEPIPFAGLVKMQDKEDTEAMLREQLRIMQHRITELEQEVMRLKDELHNQK